MDSRAYYEKIWHFYSQLYHISDLELDAKVQEITSLFPNCGANTVSARLKSCGIVVR